MVELEPGGYLRPVGHGVVTVKAPSAASRPRRGSRSTRGSARSWDFAEDIVPIFTRLGCNTGGMPWQGRRPEWLSSLALRLRPGGRLSRPSRVTAASAGCRGWFPKRACSSPRRPGTVPHGGGRRLDSRLAGVSHLAGVGSRRGPGTSRANRMGRSCSVSVEPASVPFAEPGPRQLRVLAHYQDGHQRDVTRLALYRVNDDVGRLGDARTARPTFCVGPRPT